MELYLSVTKKQKQFIDAPESEVLFGGAAGGGKSFGQIVDALLFALRYKGSRQLILRRSFAELDKSLIRYALAVYPRTIYTFNSSSHTGRFKNGSTNLRFTQPCPMPPGLVEDFICFGNPFAPRTLDIR